MLTEGEIMNSELVRIGTEEANCYLYEKLGYHKTGKTGVNI